MWFFMVEVGRPIYRFTDIISLYGPIADISVYIGIDVFALRQVLILKLFFTAKKILGLAIWQGVIT